MSAMTAALDAVAACFQLSPPRTRDSDHLALSIDGVGRLHLERNGENVLLYLAKDIDVGADRAAVQTRALDAVHFHRRHSRDVQVASRGDALVFITRLESSEIDLHAMEATIDLLSRLHEEARG
ncbi:MAG: hypothetical protein AAF830_16325 [Pseudomonadota bacterium]